MAVDSHAKAARAIKNGWLQSEITPYVTTVKDKDGNETKVTVDKDDGVREGTTLQSLGKLKAAFQKGGSTTAGNSSQMTDGAAVHGPLGWGRHAVASYTNHLQPTGCHCSGWGIRNALPLRLTTSAHLFQVAT